jgi:dihydroorotase
MKKLLIKNTKLVNEGSIDERDVYIEDDTIVEVAESISPKTHDVEVFDAEAQHLLPGMIDDQVHFRQPGMTHKEDIWHGSRAAIAGGITSFMEMPNTKPHATTQEKLQEKYDTAKKDSFANYSFMFGGTNDNLDEIKNIDPKHVPALKLFLGSSTGNMLVDDEKALTEIFENSPVIICTHCEDESTIQQNLAEQKEKFGDEIPINKHPVIRSEKACYLSSSKAVALAKKTGARLHVFHISTAKELKLFGHKKKLKNKKITAEVCIHHLWFNDEDYEKKGTQIKWNPAVKTSKDQKALLEGLKKGKIDVFATDHAPHTWEEKDAVYTKAPSGGPLVQHALPAFLEFYHQGKLSLEKIVEKACHNPAKLFQVEKRGFVKEGYKADLVLVDLNAPWTVKKDNILYKCKWSPFEGTTFKSRITHTFLNGKLVYKNFKVLDVQNAQALKFDR